MRVLRKLFRFLNKQEFEKHKVKFETNEIEAMASHLRKTIQWTDFLAKGFDYENGNYITVFRQSNVEIDGIQLYGIDKFEPNSDFITTKEMHHLWVYWNIDDCSSENYKKAFTLLTQKRDEWYKKENFNTLNTNGRIAVFETQMSTHDGAPIIESHGFVDDGDIPPIDTWFYLKDKFYGYEKKYPNKNYPDLALFCWIPKKFESRIQQASDVDILDSYDWLDELNPELNEQIMRLL